MVDDGSRKGIHIQVPEFYFDKECICRKYCEILTRMCLLLSLKIEITSSKCRSHFNSQLGKTIEEAAAQIPYL